MNGNKVIIILGKFTQEDVREGSQIGRGGSARKLVELVDSRGGKISNFYYTMGSYDFVAICEIPDEETMLKSLIIQVNKGMTKTETLVAFLDDNAIEMLNNVIIGFTYK